MGDQKRKYRRNIIKTAYTTVCNTTVGPTITVTFEQKFISKIIIKFKE